MSLFNLGGAVLQLASHTITVRRFQPDAYDTNGYASPRVSTTFSARASVQPITGQDLARLPDGVNPGELISVWSNVSLQLRDRLSVPGRGDFEVEHVDAWAESGAYSKGIARALNPQEPRP